MFEKRSDLVRFLAVVETGGLGLRATRRTGTLKKGHCADRQCASAPGGDSMNKADLVAHVATHAALPRAAADRAVSAVFAAIGDALARDEAVAIAGFGTFSTRSRSARQGRNPETGRGHRHRRLQAPAFKAGKKHRDAVNARG